MQVPLTSGAYVSRSLIADDQRCVNLFIEAGAGGSPFPDTHYPAPGLRTRATAPDNGWRCLYRTKSTGELFGVCGQTVYFISAAWALTPLGSITSIGTVVSMADNGFEILIVDGSVNGYTVNLTTKGFAVFLDPNFYGATRVDICDTYFTLNRPGTNNWYISLTNQAAFDALDIASKTSTPDPIQTQIVMGDNIWLLGALTTEIWYDTGAPDFTFGKMPGTLIEHGCAAVFSIAKYELNIYWLSQNEAGECIVMRGNSLQAQRISTHAIEAELGKYGDITDAIGLCFQMGGHAFYQLTFPGADRTWVWDESSKFWHERVWLDSNGGWHRHRANCAAFAYSENVCGDWENGNLYTFDFDTYDDAGAPILYLRTFPHLVDEARRVTYRRFVADMEVGSAAGTLADNPPMVSLRWSDDRGASFGDPVLMPLGAGGQYDTSVQWWGLGAARDRVFEISWSAPVKTALNGAWIDMVAHKS
jgi:hypothetical protein